MAMRKPGEQRKFEDEIIFRVEAIRMHLGMKKQEMAELLGIAENTYSYSLKGRAAHSPYRLRSLIEKGFTADFLFYGLTNNMDKDIISDVCSKLDDAKDHVLSRRDEPDDYLD